MVKEFDFLELSEVNKSAREFSHGLDLSKLNYVMICRYVQYSVNMYDYD